MLNEMDIKDLDDNPVTLFGDDWGLLTAQKEGRVNTMTIAAGMIGKLWGKDVVITVVQPQRYTKEFLDASDNFSVSFLEKSAKETLKYLGEVSGRDENKIEKSGLHITEEGNIPFFEESVLTFLCRKIYVGEFQEEQFVDIPLRDGRFPKKDYHSFYIGEIVKVLKKEEGSKDE